jgi:WD40 repeat protein
MRLLGKDYSFVQDKTMAAVYRGPTAPLTSVAVGGAGGNTVFAGCWDKDVWCWDRDTKSLKAKYKGHSDFVKAVVCARIAGQHVLISGGADGKLMVWDIATGKRIHTLRDTIDGMRAVQYLAIDPVDTTNDELILVSASSDPRIRRWRISISSASQMLDTSSESGKDDKKARGQGILEHETSVYRLQFDSDEGDLWTASADGTAKCLSRAQNWSTAETLKHGDYVRAVAVTEEWIITAGRDEDVKVWERATGKVFHVCDGHYEEVTGLVVVGNGTKVISVSIDGTVRTWSLAKKDLLKAREEKEKAAEGLVKEPVAPTESLMTAEEEAELAELMDEDD